MWGIQPVNYRRTQKPPGSEYSSLGVTVLAMASRPGMVIVILVERLLWHRSRVQKKGNKELNGADLNKPYSSQSNHIFVHPLDTPFESSTSTQPKQLDSIQPTYSNGTPTTSVNLSADSCTLIQSRQASFTQCEDSDGSFAHLVDSSFGSSASTQPKQFGFVQPTYFAESFAHLVDPPTDLWTSPQSQQTQSTYTDEAFAYLTDTSLESPTSAPSNRFELSACMFRQIICSSGEHAYRAIYFNMLWLFPAFQS